MAAVRTAARISTGGLTRILTGHSSNQHDKSSIILARCSPVFHRLLKDVYSKRMRISPHRCFSASTTLDGVDSTAIETMKFPTASEKTPDVFDEVLSNVEKRSVSFLLNKWLTNARKCKKEKRQFNVEKMLNKADLKRIGVYTLDQTSPPETRVKLLTILLSSKIDVSQTKDILNQTVEQATSLPVKVLLQVVELLASSWKTEARISAREALVRSLVNTRCAEVEGRKLVSLMYQLDEMFDMRQITLENRRYLKSNTKAKQAEAKDSGTSAVSPPAISSTKLEAQALEKIDDLTAMDLSRVLLLLAKWRSRNEPLIYAVLHRMEQENLSDMTYMQLRSQLLALSALKLYNTSYLDTLSVHLLSQRPASVYAACGILSVMSSLKWRNLELILATLDYLVDKSESMSIREANSVIMALSHLYPIPFQEKHANLIIELSHKVHSPCSKEPDNINVIWSLAVLLLLSGEIANPVLQSDVIQQVEAVTSSHSRQTLLHQLAQINLAAKHELMGYTGPFLPDHLLNSGQEMDKQTNPGTATLLNNIKKFADLSKYVRTTEALPFGLKVDAVMCTNSSGSVMPISALEDKNSQQQVYKLALLVVPFHDMTSGSGIPCGSQQINGRLLRHLGYIPVFILYSDLLPTSTAEIVNNIKQKMVSAVERHTQTNKQV